MQFDEFSSFIYCIILELLVLLLILVYFCIIIEILSLFYILYNSMTQNV